MSATKNGGPAFPEHRFEHYGDGAGRLTTHGGMSLRDWFAGQALAGITGGYWSNPEMSGLGPMQLAAEAYAYADAMLAARTEGGASND